MVTPDQKAAFDDKGYLVCSALLAADETAALNAASARVLAHDGPEVAREADGAPHVIYGVHLLDAGFAALARHPAIVAIGRDLIGAPFFVHQSRLNAKQTGGSIVDWHQDFGTYHRVDGLPEPRGLMIAVFLDEITACNAPLMAIPRTQRHGVVDAAVNAAVPDHDGAAKFRYDITPETVRDLVAENGLEALTGPAGTVVFMQINVVHGSTVNITPLRRLIAYLNVSAVDNQGRTFARPPHLAARDFAAVEPLGADCLRSLA